MKKRNNIDRSFQKRFEGFEPQAPAGAWDAIESRLEKSEKDRKALPLWWKFAGVAAMVAVVLSIILWNPTTIENSNQDTLVQKEKNQIKESKENSSLGEKPSKAGSSNTQGIMSDEHSMDASLTKTDKKEKNSSLEPGDVDLQGVKEKESIVTNGTEQERLQNNSNQQDVQTLDDAVATARPKDEQELGDLNLISENQNDQRAEIINDKNIKFLKFFFATNKENFKSPISKILNNE